MGREVLHLVEVIKSERLFVVVFSFRLGCELMTYALERQSRLDAEAGLAT